MSESLGTARLDIEVNSANFEAAFARAKNVAHGLGQEAEAAFQRADSGVKKSATSLIRWSEVMGKTVDEQKLLNAAMRGVPVEVIAAVEQKMRANAEATMAAARATELLGIKAQHAADGLAFEEAAAGAARVRRLQESVSVFTAELDRLEAEERQLASNNAFIGQLQRQANAIGKTRAELLELEAAEKGVSAAAAPFIAKLKEQEAALFTTGKQFNAYGLSVKQTQAALRQVPAQLTDIFVSLQGGQNPLTVLIQQGGQLKDVFGGIKPAAEALGNAVLKMVNPWTLAAAAIVAYVAAVNDAQSRQAALANALVLTGNAAGASTEQLQRMANVLDETTAASERHASAVVAQVSATGRFTIDQVAEVSKAALQMEEATGRSIQQTIQDFAAIGDDPVQAIIKLNGVIGDATGITNFLTAETIKSVEELQRQGDTAEASRILFEAYADAINDRAPQVTQNLSIMARQWKAIKEFAGDAMDATVNALNAMDEAAVDAIRNITEDMPHFLGFLPKEIDPPDIRPLEPIKISNAQLAAYHALQAEIKTNLTDEQRQAEEITRIRNQGAVAVKAGLMSAKEVQDAILASEKKFADQQSKKGRSGAGEARSLENAQAKAALQEVKDRLLEEQTAIDNSNRLLQAKYAARLVTSETYYSETRRLAEEGAAAQEKALLAEIDVLSQRDVKGKVSVDNLRQIGQLEAQLAKLRADSGTQLAILSIQEAEFYERRAENIQKYKDALEESNIALQAQVNYEIAKIGMGQQEAAQQQRINAIYAEQAEELRKLNAELARNPDFQAQYDAEVQARQEATDAQIRIVTEGFDAMRAAEQDWRNGLRAGLQDWIAQTADVAAQIRNITGRELDMATDALVEFATTGKLEIKELLASMLKELVKFFAQRAVMQFAQMFLGSLFPSSSNFGIPLPGSGPPVKFNAMGNSFAGGTSLPSNTVLTQPTLFKFAKGGAFGVGGEAGAEAVMPLERGPGGKLGVRNYGNSGSPVMVHSELHIHNDGTVEAKTATQGDAGAYKDFLAIMQNTSKQTIEQEMRPGGSLWRAGVKA